MVASCSRPVPMAREQLASFDPSGRDRLAPLPGPGLRESSRASALLKTPTEAVGLPGCTCVGLRFCSGASRMGRERLMASSWILPATSERDQLEQPENLRLNDIVQLHVQSPQIMPGNTGSPMAACLLLNMHDTHLQTWLPVTTCDM